mmetsp:Transcript_71969/g.187216  ORF Transcript_71969/g.187216 Transcript_71969/m.187216 type:complete len:202 (+) Transcript_71969:680-1285(+)
MSARLRRRTTPSARASIYLRGRGSIRGRRHCMVNRLHLQKAKHRRARRGAGCRTKILEAVRQALANGLPMVNMNGRRRLALYNNLVRGSEVRGSGEKVRVHLGHKAADGPAEHWRRGGRAVHNDTRPRRCVRGVGPAGGRRARECLPWQKQHRRGGRRITPDGHGTLLQWQKKPRPFLHPSLLHHARRREEWRVRDGNLLS